MWNSGQEGHDIQGVWTLLTVVFSGQRPTLTGRAQLRLVRQKEVVNI